MALQRRGWTSLMADPVEKYECEEQNSSSDEPMLFQRNTDIFMTGTQKFVLFTLLEGCVYVPWRQIWWKSDRKKPNALLMGICEWVCVWVRPVLRKAVNKSPSPNVRYYLRGETKGQSRHGNQQKVKGKQGGEALGKGRLAPVKIRWMWAK